MPSIRGAVLPERSEGGSLKDALSTSNYFSDLARFWEAATLPIPIVIVGGGRWGRVWASVIAAARGNSNYLAMVARTDFALARAWASETSDAAGITVCQSISQAMALMPELEVAIISSRPANHLEDSLKAFDHGLHVLVEKPISTSAAYGMQILERSFQIQRKLAVGTEFAFIPALHQCVREIGIVQGRQLKVTVYWDDPADEARYGATKLRHAEVDALTDLLPHAFSIFSTVSPSRKFQIADIWQNANGNSGHLRLQDWYSGNYLLVFDLASSKRRRVVELVSGVDFFAIDFSAKCSTITKNGRPQELDPVLQPMTSTLRLQLGALFSDIAVENTKIAIDPAILAMIEIQAAMEEYGN